MARFSASDITDGLDLIHVSLDCSWQDAEVLRNLFPRDSSVALHELFELFFAEGRMSANRVSLPSLSGKRLEARLSIIFVERSYIQIYAIADAHKSICKSEPYSLTDQ